ncbi:MAG: hypothetical protein RIK87_17545 [Fuerstiella sp.]
MYFISARLCLFDIESTVMFSAREPGRRRAATCHLSPLPQPPAGSRQPPAASRLSWQTIQLTFQST